MIERRANERIITQAYIVAMFVGLLGALATCAGCAHTPVDIGRMSVTGLTRFETAVDGAIVTWTRTEQQRIKAATVGDAERELLTAHRDTRNRIVKALDKVTECRRVVATVLQPGPDVPVVAELGPPAADLANAVKYLVSEMRAANVPVPEVKP